MRNYIENYLNEYDFSCPAKQEFLSAYDKIVSDKVSNDLLNQAISMYNESFKCDYKYICNDILSGISTSCGVHVNTANVILFICLSKRLEFYYEQAGYSKQIYKDTIADLMYKTIEDYPKTKVWGWSKPAWFCGFFNLTRFGFDQLQFELITFNEEYHKNCVDLYPESKVITVHLPMTGKKLNADEVPNTFKKAGEFFKQFLKEGPIVFYCKSWLMHSIQLPCLNENSQILKFRNLFEILGEQYYDNNNVLERVFDTTDFSDLSKLPCKTSLQKHYIKVLESGGKAGYAWGIYVYQK
ncbi:MAG: hypothetical protein IJW26_01445 [Clostridia bacterium]|nr:hypothetical protein [Clostridia bacterium]